MHIFPAIDLLGGNAVRLQRGDYQKSTVYSTCPLSVAQGFCQNGAKYLHVVDLDGAKDGTAVNFPVIRQLIEESGLQVEVGGGIRTPETVERYLALGAYRVILGTAALTDPAFLQSMVDRYHEKIAVGVDVKDGKVAIKGWLEVSGQDAFAFCETLQSQGIAGIICTDISKDGMLGGTNMAFYQALAARLKMDITASGGVSTLEDIHGLKALGMHSAIVGKALYTADMLLKDALEAAL